MRASRKTVDAETDGPARLSRKPRCPRSTIGSCRRSLGQILRCYAAEANTGSGKPLPAATACDPARDDAAAPRAEHIAIGRHAQRRIDGRTIRHRWRPASSCAASIFVNKSAVPTAGTRAR
jgi:hypothetical protein